MEFSEALQTIWTLVGYAVMFFVPVLAISKESRTALKQFILQMLSDEPPQAVKEVSTPAPAVHSAPAPPNITNIATSDAPISDESSSSLSNSEQSSRVDPREIAEELRRRIESGEEMDEDFVVRTASVLGISKETILGAFDVPELSSAKPVASAVPTPAPSSSGSTPLPPSSSAPVSASTDTVITPEPLATDWIRDLLPEGQEIGLLSR